MNKIEVFNDTLRQCRTPALADAIAKSKSGTKVYAADEYPPLPEHAAYGGKITVTPQRTFEAAFSLASEYPEVRIGVLNFANSVNPGGGVKMGASAQEECLCRCSTLYPCIDTELTKKAYYHPNRKKYTALATDACIYTPDVIVFKTDDRSYEPLPEEKWLTTDVITCAAPDLRIIKLSREKQYNIHQSRGRHILTVAAANGIEVLVLGAFGCGAFMNHNETVAQAYKDILPEFSGYFREIRFAVASSPDKPSRNYLAFDRILNEK